MMSVTNENTYNKILISKIKQRTGQKELKKIVNSLKNIAEDDVKKLSKLKIKIFEEKIEEDEKVEFKISAPLIGLQHYIKDLKKLNSKIIVNQNDEPKRENISSSVNNNEEELKQIDSSDFSDDE